MLKKIVWIGVAIVVIALIALYPKISLYLTSRTASINDSQMAFYIEEATDLEKLAGNLKEAGIIDDPEGFIKVGEYKELNSNNIALGKYLIEPGTQYRNLLNGFKMNAAGNGNGEVEVNVTFNNCRFLSEMAGKVAAVTMMDSAELLIYLSDPNTFEKFGFTKEQFPAMFLPNTYKMYYDTDAEHFTQRMADEFKTFWTQERKSKLTTVGLKSPSEVVTLASIVYSEQSGHPEEWQTISGLYLNRIEQNIKLQSDPTFKFCWGTQLDGVQRLLNVHRDIDCSYNTYKIYGLPPGPICIPPPSAIDAVLNREEHDYIFMMARPDYSGLHDFSEDYSKHDKLAKIYQKWLAAEMNK